MAMSIPQEIVDMIAGYLQDAGASLAPCTTVCRKWQAAFEPLLYSALIIYSDDDVNRETSERTMSLSHFQAVTSGRRIRRRTLIHRLEYYLVVPVALPDWTTRKSNGAYTIDNDTRKNNDVAFQSAIVKLFNILTQWDETLRISVDLKLLSLEAGNEPLTHNFEFAAEYSWEFIKGKRKATPVYRAKLLEDGTSLLPSVSCIDRLSFETPEFDTSQHQIWAGSAMQIIQKCPNITELRLGFEDWIRPDHLGCIRARRQAISGGLEIIPRSLRVLHFSNQHEEPWKKMMPALNVLTSDHDSLSPGLRHLSLSLCEIKIENVSLAPDFLYPLDSDGYPLPDSASLHWPRLKKLELHAPPFLPSGQWVLHPTPDSQKYIDEVDENNLWEYIISDLEEGNVGRETWDFEHFHKILISLGHAARSMPRLVSLRYRLNHTPNFRFDFQSHGESNAEWVLKSTYRPDQRVADAWKFSFSELAATRCFDDHRHPGFMVMHLPWRMERGHDL